MAEHRVTGVFLNSASSPRKDPAWPPAAVPTPAKLFLVSDVACRVLNFSVYLKHVSLAASGGRDQGGVASKSKRVCAGEGRGGSQTRRGSSGRGGSEGLAFGCVQEFHNFPRSHPLRRPGRGPGFDPWHSCCRCRCYGCWC